MSNESDIITAVSTAATAIFAVLTYVLVFKQSLLTKPTISLSDSGDSNKQYRNFIVNIDSPDDKKWAICEIKILKSTCAKIAEKVTNPATNNPEPGSWQDQIQFDSKLPGAGVFFTSTPGDIVNFEVSICLKANEKMKLKYKLKSKMHEFKKL